MILTLIKPTRGPRLFQGLQGVALKKLGAFSGCPSSIEGSMSSASPSRFYPKRWAKKLKRGAKIRAMYQPQMKLSKAEKECRPAQEFEAWQEDAKRLVLYWEARKHQVADDANHIENHEEKAQTQSECHHWNISCTAARCGHGDSLSETHSCNVQQQPALYRTPGCICLGCICPGACPGIIAIIAIPIWGARSSLAVFF